MSHVIDLSDIYDDCYEGYQDFHAEIELRKQGDKWSNDTVSFWKSETLGWRFSEVGGKSNYGYDTLTHAVKCYLAGKCSEQASDQNFCASRLLNSTNKRNFDKFTCEAIHRYFINGNQDMIDRTNEALTTALNKLISGETEQEETQESGINMTM